MKVGDNTRYFIDDKNYLAGVIVKICEDETVWIEYDNGQQIHYQINELVLE